MRHGIFWEPVDLGTRKSRSLLDDYLLLLPAPLQELLKLKDRQKTITSRAINPMHVVNAAADRNDWKEYIREASQVNQRLSLKLRALD